MSLEIGQVFAGYTIRRVLGEGAMGTVYLAAHPRLPREDALKVLPADLTADPEFRARFVREAEMAAGLSHPHIVRIHDRGEHDGQFWISMDYVAGAVPMPPQVQRVYVKILAKRSSHPVPITRVIETAMHQQERWLAILAPIPELQFQSIGIEVV